MDELKKYIIEGQIQDELISEMDETNQPNIEENYYMEYKAKKLVESVLREFDMAIAAQPPMPEDPYKNVDPKVKKSQQLVRVLQDHLYKICDSQAVRPGEDVDADIKALMISNLEPTVKAIVNKLHSIWFGEQKPQEPEQEKATIVIGQEVITPQQESYKIKQINGEKIVLEGITGTKIVEKTILEKWLKE